jgi:hypothetical protein
MFGKTGCNMHFYAKTDINGTSDFPGFMTITGSKVTGSTGNVSATTTGIVTNNVFGTRISTGIYKFDGFSIPMSAAVFTDFGAVWTITSSVSAALTDRSTSVIIKSPFTIDNEESLYNFIIAIPKFKDSVQFGDKIRYQLFIRNLFDHIQSVTGQSSNLSTFIAKNAYFKVVDDRGLDIYPYDDISYNNSVNYFDLDTRYLSVGQNYRLVIKIIDDFENIHIFDLPEYGYFFKII